MNFGLHILGRSVSYRFVLCQLLIGSSFGGLAGRSAAEPPGRSPDGPLRYRRILLPPDQLETWSKEDVRYLPVDRDEFHRRMKRIGRAGLGAPPDDLPLIGRAFYEARLDEASLLRGTARLEIMHRGDHPALLSLAPCELAISAVHWDVEQEGEVPLGNSSQGELEVVVDRSATLGFAWTVRGTRRSGDRLIFELQLPDSASKQLRVELPSDLILRVPDGRVVQETVDDSGSTEAAKRWWRVELGRRNRVSLEVASEATQHVPPRWPAVRQRLIYHVSPRGLELTAQLTMDSGKKFEQRFPILVDPSLQVVDVMVGKRHLPWRVATKGAGESRTILIDLSGPISDDGQVVRLVARAPLVTEGRWRLPMARTTVASWESGKIELLVASPLTLNRLELSDCRQVGWEPIATPQQGESFEIEAFSPSASVDVTIAWLEAKRTMRTATTLSLGPREVTATTIVSVKVARGRYFDLEARVGPHWIIDAVASNPSDALAGWLHQRAGQTEGQLVMNLSRALVPGRALQLTITGRLQRSGLARSLHIGELEMLRFRQRRSPLYLLRSADPFRLAVSGDQRLTIRDPARLDAAEASLFHDLESGLLFEADRSADSLEVSLVRRRPRFDAEIEAATVIQGNTLGERFTFHCVPESASIDRVLVRLLGTGGPPYRWSVEGGEENEPAARRLSGKERAAWGTERPGDVWEITFRQPQTAPFSFKAERTLPFRGPHEVNLASLLEADRQQARVVVEALDGRDIDVRNDHLTPIPAGQAERHSGTTVRAAFHYEPRHDLSAGAESRLSVAPSQRATQPAAWVWKCRLDTQAASDGATLHRATYWIQNRSRTAIDFELPIGSQLRSVTLDGLSVAEDRVLADQRDLRIALPSQLRFPTVALCFVTADPPLKILGVRKPAWPVCKLPVLDREWNLWLAPNCDLLSLHALASPEKGPSNGRLLGSLDPVSLSSLLLSEVDARGQAEADPRHSQKSPNQLWGRQLPWKLLDPLTSQLVGWRTARWSAADGGIPTQVTILYRPSLKVGAWLLFLLFASATYANRLKRPWRLIAAAGLTGALSLAIPAVIASLGIAMLAGMACGVLGHLFHGRRRRPSRSATRTTQLPAGQVAGLLLVITTLVAPVTRVAWSAEDDASQSQRASSTDVAAGPILHQVLVPVDGQRSPIGNQVYLAEPFLRELYRRDLAASARPRDGMVTAATYHATLVRDTVAKRLIVHDLEASFDVIVFDTNRTVSIALPRDQAGWNVAGATVDGRAVKLQWDDKQGAFTFPVDDPGRYRLTVIFQSRIDNVTDGIDLKIPRVNQTQLRLAAADGTEPFELPTVRGVMTYDRNRHSVVAELGPAERLVIKGQSPLTRGSDTAELEISEMTWLRVRPGTVLMDVKWRVRPLRGRIRKVRLHCSPRLRLMPFPKEGPVESVESVPGVPHELRLQLRRATSDTFTIEAEFLVRGAAGIGRLPLPRPRLLGGGVIDRRLAVSVDEGLEYREFNTQELQAIPIPEFCDAWGDASDEPTLAYAMPAGDVDWQLVTQPRKPKTAVALRHDLLLEAGRAEVAFQAELTTDIGYRFGYELHVPESLEVDRLSLTAGSERCSARWARADATTVCVFLSEPLSGAATLSLRGSLPLPRQGRLPLPMIDLPGTEVHSREYQIRRRFPLRVDVQTGAGFEPLPSAIDGGAVDPRTPLVAAFTVADRTADALLTISTNRPQVSGCGVTSLRHEGGTWVADWDARVEVRGGEVGQLVVDVPGWWSGPYRVSPDAVLEIVDLPSLDLRRLVLRPSHPIRDGERLHIDGPLEQTADQQIRLPDIRPRTSGSWRRLVRLPKVEHGKNRSHDHVWEMRGLRPARASEIPDWSGPSDDQPLWLRVVGRRRLVVVQNVAMPAKGTPEITLADVQIAPAGTNSPLCGLASFDLLPAGLRDCIVEIPADGRLIQVLLEGRATTLARIDDHRWRLTLESDRLPQRIGVLFAPRVAEAEGTPDRCQAPMLAAGDRPIAVRQTQWTVYGPIGEQTSDARVGAVEHEWERMQQLAMILDRSRRAWDTLPAGVRTDWYGAWLRRLRASGERLERLSAQQADRIGMVREAQRTSPKTTQEVPHDRTRVSYDEVLGRAQKLLATHDPSTDPSLPQVPAETEPLTPDVTETPERWFPALFAGVEPATYWHFRGSQPTIRWQPTTSSGRSIPAGWLPAGAVLLLTLVALLARHYVVRDDSLEQGHPSDDTMSSNAPTETL